jgi:deoxyribodipyrimidine photo-lyase
MTTVIVWFRNDLRLHDNPALFHAVRSGAGVLPVYIDDTTPHPWSAGAASRWWLHHSLAALDAALKQRGNRLYLFQGDPNTILADLIEDTGAQALYANRRYQPHHEAMDRRLQAALQERQCRFHIHDANLLHPPEAILNQQGRPYKVFTPYYKASLTLGVDGPVHETPASIPVAAKPRHTVTLKSLGLLPSLSWGKGLYAHWSPGEAAARQRLKTFIDTGLADYPQQRDVPSLDGTSRLSPHLHFGELSPRELVTQLRRSGHPAANEVIRQLIWRDFAHAVLHHFPRSSDHPFNESFENFPWNKRSNKQLKAWQQGQTGIPIIDAGMRELWHTGYMHNRVRMLVGSLLTKNLLLHWQHGARWFWDTLVDADLAQNSMNWQWVAGCGVDAAPYFRIFNPVTQGEKFDANGDYVRRWVPELTALDGKWLHRPWEAPDEILAKAGIRLGKEYPKPIVDLKLSRQQALDAYRRLK